jgi:hypothetical protein
MTDAARPTARKDKTMHAKRTAPRQVLRAAAAAAVLAAHPGCDPANLEPAQRRLVTGTSEVATIEVAVAPAEATLESDPQEFRYAVTVRDASGPLRLSVSLSALPPEAELATDLTAPTATIAGRGGLDGAFAVRALARREEPVDLFVTVASTDTGGGRAEHPPVRVRLHLRPPAPDLDCTRDPSAGSAPLTVAFSARASRCTGACTMHWEFGDGASADRRNAEHVYASAGSYEAVGTLTDGPMRVSTCRRKVVVTEPDEPSPPPLPAPTPSPSPIPALTASFTMRDACCPATLNLDARGSIGAIVQYSWDLSWTTVSPDLVSASPTASFPVGEGSVGRVTLQVATADGRVATLGRPYP